MTNNLELANFSYTSYEFHSDYSDGPLFEQLRKLRECSLLSQAAALVKEEPVTYSTMNLKAKSSNKVGGANEECWFEAQKLALPRKVVRVACAAR